MNLSPSTLNAMKAAAVAQADAEFGCFSDTLTGKVLTWVACLGVCVVILGWLMSV
jgi:hypothetical protein